MLTDAEQMSDEDAAIVPDSKGGKESMQVHIWYQICLLCKYKSTNSDTSEQSMQIQQSNWQIVC